MPAAALRHVTALVLWAALACLWVGLKRPILRIEKFWWFENEVSVWNGTWALIHEGEAFIGGIVLVFSILFPILKNLVLIAILHGWAWLAPYSRGLVHFVAVLGKWSMLDVFLVALVVSSVKLGAIASAEIQSGIYWFVVSVLLTNLISTFLDGWMRHSTEVSESSAPPPAA